MINTTSVSTGAITGSGNWVQGLHASLNTQASTINIFSIDAATNDNSINYSRPNVQTIYNTTYHNLLISGSNTKTLPANIIVNNDLEVDVASIASSTFTLTVLGSTTLTNAGIINTSNLAGIFNLQDVILNNGAINGSATGTVNCTNLSTTSSSNIIGRCNFNNLGTSLINGQTTFNNNTGVKTFSGNILISATGTWTSTTVSTTGNMIFQNGITNNGISFAANGATFNTNNQELNGSTAFSFSGIITVTGIVLTNNNSVTTTNAVVAAITGTGSWTQATNSILNTTAISISLASMDASANGNLVNYNRNNVQTVFPSTYYNLTIANGNTKTLGGNSIALNDLIVSATTLASSTFSLTVSGLTTISGNGNLSTTALTGLFNLQNVILNSSRIVGTAKGTEI